MSNVLKSSQLIDSIKRKGMIPSDQKTFNDSDFLNMLNEELQYFGVPHLLSTYEEYLVFYKDVDAASVTDGRIKIPYRSVGNKLREATYIDTTGNFYELSRITLDDLPDYSRNQTSTYPEVFYVEGSDIVLVDELPSSGSFRLYFYLRPNKLVLDEKVGIISNINRTTGQITLEEFPVAFSTITKLDFIEANSPNKIFNYDIPVVSTDSTLKMVEVDPDDIPLSLDIGDHIAQVGETIVPQLPTELHGILAQRVVVAALEALGDEQGVSVAQSRLAMMEKASLTLIDDRVEGAPQKIVNRSGILRTQTSGSRNLRRTGRY